MLQKLLLDSFPIAKNLANYFPIVNMASDVDYPQRQLLPPLQISHIIIWTTKIILVNLV